MDTKSQAISSTIRTFSEIMEIIKKRMGIKKDSDFAKLMGVRRSVVWQWKDRKKIPFLELTRFCLRENMDLMWLLTGKVVGKDEAKTEDKDSVTFILEDMNQRKKKDIFYTLEFPEEFCSPNFVVKRIRGARMEPVIKDNALIGIDLSSNAIVSGEIYLINCEGGLKDLVRVQVKIASFVLHKDNPLPGFVPEEIPLQELHEDLFFGRVIWALNPI